MTTASLSIPRRIARLVLLNILLAFLISGCSEKRETTMQGTIRFVDDLKRTVNLMRYPVRIVSLAPSITETIFALGADSLLVGVTEYCTYPPQAQLKTNVGSMTSPSIDAIEKLKPDLILMTVEGNQEVTFQKLKGIGVPVFVTNPRSIESIKNSLRDIGRLTRHEDAARRYIDSIEAARIEVRRDTIRPAPSVLMFVCLRPLMVVSSNTYLHELLRTAGGKNLAAHLGGTYITYRREQVLIDDPDVIIVPDDDLSSKASVVKIYPEWNTLRAVKNDRLYFVRADLLQRPGPRIGAGLRLVHALLKEGNHTGGAAAMPR